MTASRFHSQRLHLERIVVEGHQVRPAARREHAPPVLLERLEGHAGGVRRERLGRVEPLVRRPAAGRIALRVRRVTATARPSSGTIDETGQSLPIDSRAPLSAMVRIGYWRALRSGPSRGSTSDTMPGSRQAHSGSKLAITPSRGEPAQVGRVDQVRVRDDRPAVAWTVHLVGPLHRVQGGPHAGVPDRVDVHLETRWRRTP